jgi:hypothetical protein
MAEIIQKGEQSYVKDGGKLVPVYKIEFDNGDLAYENDNGDVYEIDSAPEAYSPSAYDYGQQIVGQGTLMGFGDEIMGFGKGLYDYATTDKGFKDSIYDRIDEERAQMAKAEESLGMPATLALQAGGGLLTGGLGAGRAIAGKGLAMAPKLFRAAKQGFVQGGLTGAGMSEGGFDTEGLLNRAGGAGKGAVAGMVLGPALTGAGHGIGKGISSVGRMLPGGVDRQAAGVLRAVTPKKDIARMEQQTLANPVSVAADFAPVDTKKVVGEATRTIGSGPQVKYLKARHQSQASRIVPTVDDLISPDNVAAKIEKLAKQRQTTAAKNYGKFYETPVELTPQLKSYFERDAFKEAYKFAKKLANNEGIDLPPLFSKTADGAKSYIKPTAQLLDYIKQGMDAVVDTAYKKSGTLGTSAKVLRNEYRDHLDDLMPDYKQARSEYAGHSAAIEAAENGRKFMMSVGDEGKALKGFGRKDIADLGEHELEAFRSGAASALRDKIDKKGFGANIATMLESRGGKLDLNALLGRDGAREFRKVLKAEMKMAETWAENQGSQTAQRISAGNTMGTSAATLTDAALTGNFAPVLGVARQAMNAVAPQPEAVAKRISQLMASPKMADKMEAFRMLKGGAVQRPLGKLGGYAQGAASGVGGYLGGKLGANY